MIYIERADIGLDNIISLHMARAIESKVNMRYRCGCKKLDHFNDLGVCIYILYQITRL